MATQVRHKKPLRNRINFRLSDDHMAQYESHGGVLYIRALIDADIAKEARRAKIKGG
jgi:hypothetical protein